MGMDTQKIEIGLFCQVDITGEEIHFFVRIREGGRSAAEGVNPAAGCLGKNQRKPSSTRMDRKPNRLEIALPSFPRVNSAVTR